MAGRAFDTGPRVPYHRDSAGEGTMRAFLAVEVPEAVQDRLSDVIRQLSSTGSRVKWVDPRHIHVTLKFFADLAPEARARVEEAVQGRAPASAPFPLAVRGLGAFRSGSRIRVLWAALEDPSGGLSALQESLEQTLLLRGIPREERPFRPHLTLGRCREPSSDPRLEDLLRQLAAFHAGEFKADRLTLFRSTLTPAGPHYDVLRRWPLGGNP